MFPLSQTAEDLPATQKTITNSPLLTSCTYPAHPYTDAAPTVDRNGRIIPPIPPLRLESVIRSGVLATQPSTSLVPTSAKIPSRSNSVVSPSPLGNTQKFKTPSKRRGPLPINKRSKTLGHGLSASTDRQVLTRFNTVSAKAVIKSNSIGALYRTGVAAPDKPACPCTPSTSKAPFTSTTATQQRRTSMPPENNSHQLEVRAAALHSKLEAVMSEIEQKYTEDHAQTEISTMVMTTGASSNPSVVSESAPHTNEPLHPASAPASLLSEANVQLDDHLKNASASLDQSSAAVDSSPKHPTVDQSSRIANTSLIPAPLCIEPALLPIPTNLHCRNELAGDMPNCLPEQPSTISQVSSAPPTSGLGRASTLEEQVAAHFNGSMVALSFGDDVAPIDNGLQLDSHDAVPGSAPASPSAAAAARIPPVAQSSPEQQTILSPSESDVPRPDKENGQMNCTSPPKGENTPSPALLRPPATTTVNQSAPEVASSVQKANKDDPDCSTDAPIHLKPLIPRRTLSDHDRALIITVGVPVPRQSSHTPPGRVTFPKYHFWKNQQTEKPQPNSDLREGYPLMLWDEEADKSFENDVLPKGEHKGEDVVTIADTIQVPAEVDNNTSQSPITLSAVGSGPSTDTDAKAISVSTPLGSQSEAAKNNHSPSSPLALTGRLSIDQLCRPQYPVSHSRSPTPGNHILIPPTSCERSTARAEEIDDGSIAPSASYAAGEEGLEVEVESGNKQGLSGLGDESGPFQASPFFLEDLNEGLGSVDDKRAVLEATRRWGVKRIFACGTPADAVLQARSLNSNGSDRNRPGCRN